MENKKTIGQKIVWEAGGLVIAYAVTGILLLLLAFILYKFDLTEKMVRMGIHAIYMISCLTGGVYIGHRGQNKKFLWGVTAGILYFVTLLLLTFLIGGGERLDTERIPLVLCLCLGGGTIGGMLSK